MMVMGWDVAGDWGPKHVQHVPSSVTWAAQGKARATQDFNGKLRVLASSSHVTTFHASHVILQSPLISLDVEYQVF